MRHWLGFSHLGLSSFSCRGYRGSEVKSIDERREERTVKDRDGTEWRQLKDIMYTL